MDGTNEGIPIYDSRRGAHRRRVCYIYDPNITTFAYPAEHPMPMVPFRLTLTHMLIEAYGLTRRMEVMRPPRATFDEMAAFHTREYLELLIANDGSIPAPDEPHRMQTRSQTVQKRKALMAAGFGDCPPFDGVYDFSALSAGGSLMAARKLCEGQHDVTINWGGGLHHAMRGSASGFCYVNDAVLAINILLQSFSRVIYVDIDLHHGDGVEKAFEDTDRVFTLSFHKHAKNFFPCTGNVQDVGVGDGKYYTMNVPLMDGIRNVNYLGLFRSLTSRVADRFQPEVIVLQCGADSLSADLMDGLNLSTRGHGVCVSHLLSFNLPLLLLGGGGYKPPNVARCWTHETALALGKELDNNLPVMAMMQANQHLAFAFGSTYLLHVKADPNLTDWNTRSYLNGIMYQAFKNLEQMPHAPGIDMSYTSTEDEMDVTSTSDDEAMDEEDTDEDVRLPQRLRDRMVEADNEF